jgi:hypothetical protein
LWTKENVQSGEWFFNFFNLKSVSTKQDRLKPANIKRSLLRWCE